MCGDGGGAGSGEGNDNHDMSMGNAGKATGAGAYNDQWTTNDGPSPADPSVTTDPTNPDPTAGNMMAAYSMQNRMDLANELANFNEMSQNRASPFSFKANDNPESLASLNERAQQQANPNDTLNTVGPPSSAASMWANLANNPAATIKDMFERNPNVASTLGALAGLVTFGPPGAMLGSFLGSKAAGVGTGEAAGTGLGGFFGGGLGGMAGLGITGGIAGSYGGRSLGAAYDSPDGQSGRSVAEGAGGKGSKSTGASAGEAYAQTSPDSPDQGGIGYDNPLVRAMLKAQVQPHA
jgi:hypothetical protein